MGDAARLRQIVVNLLSNAVKFSANREIIIKVALISTGNHGNQKNFSRIFQGELWFIQTSVQDFGIGIPKMAQATIFEPFTQADTSMTRKYVSFFPAKNTFNRFIIFFPPK